MQAVRLRNISASQHPEAVQTSNIWMNMRAILILMALVLMPSFTDAIAQEALPTVALEGFEQQKAFGLVFGQSKEEVAVLAGQLTENKNSQLRNAYSVDRLPNENLGIPVPYVIAARHVYFDDAGHLWRVRVKIGPSPMTSFTPDDAFAAYFWLKNILEKDKGFVESIEQAPYVNQKLQACSLGKRWAVAEPAAYAAAEAKAPSLSFTQRTVFDIACHAIPKWESKFTSHRVDYTLLIGFGKFYETPVVLTVERGDKGDIRTNQKLQRMLKSVETPSHKEIDDPDDHSLGEISKK